LTIPSDITLAIAKARYSLKNFLQRIDKSFQYYAKEKISQTQTNKTIRETKFKIRLKQKNDEGQGCFS
jgi:hypothetical protein